MKFLKTLDKDLLELSVKYASRNFVSKKNVMYTSRVTSLLHKVLQRALTGWVGKGKIGAIFQQIAATASYAWRQKQQQQEESLGYKNEKI